jgi:hypothetical protein
MIDFGFDITLLVLGSEVDDSSVNQLNILFFTIIELPYPYLQLRRPITEFAGAREPRVGAFQSFS